MEKIIELILEKAERRFNSESKGQDFTSTIYSVLVDITQQIWSYMIDGQSIEKN